MGLRTRSVRLPAGRQVRPIYYSPLRAITDLYFSVGISAKGDPAMAGEPFVSHACPALRSTIPPQAGPAAAGPIPARLNAAALGGYYSPNLKEKKLSHCFFVSG